LLLLTGTVAAEPAKPVNELAAVLHPSLQSALQLFRAYAALDLPGPADPKASKEVADEVFRAQILTKRDALFQLEQALTESEAAPLAAAQFRTLLGLAQEDLARAWEESWVPSHLKEEQRKLYVMALADKTDLSLEAAVERYAAALEICREHLLTGPPHALARSRLAALHPHWHPLRQEILPGPPAPAQDATPAGRACQEAWASWQERDLSGAQCEFEHALALRPHHPEAQLGLALIALYYDDFEAALPGLERAFLEPELALEARLGLAIAWRGLGLYHEAALAYEAMMLERPDDARVWLNGASFHLVYRQSAHHARRCLQGYLERVGRSFEPAPQADVLLQRLSAMAPDHGPREGSFEAPASRSELFPLPERVLLTQQDDPWLSTGSAPRAFIPLNTGSASWTATRAYLRRGQLPPPDAVRIEEFLPALKQRLPAPQGAPLTLQLDAMPAPAVLDEPDVLLRTALRARALDPQRRPLRAVLLIDRSGSMDEPSKLPALQSALRSLLGKLGPHDEIGVLAFDARPEILQQLAPLRRKRRLVRRLAALRTQGPTNALAALRAAYDMLGADHEQQAVGRVVLCTDSLLDTGIVGFHAAQAQVERRRGAVTLSALAMGASTRRDPALESLAAASDGLLLSASDTDSALRALERGLFGSGALIGKEASLDIRFDPKRVQAYRRIGHEGQVGAAPPDNLPADLSADQRATALFALRLDPRAPPGTLATARLRYRDPASGQGHELERSISSTALPTDVGEAPGELRLDALLVAFAQELSRGGRPTPQRFDPLLRELEHLPGRDRPADAIVLSDTLRQANEARRRTLTAAARRRERHEAQMEKLIEQIPLLRAMLERAQGCPDFDEDKRKALVATVSQILLVVDEQEIEMASDMLLFVDCIRSLVEDEWARCPEQVPAWDADP